ncbi:MAG: hypothetical protein LBP29_02260 [Treponema sp.]|jgi:hypothetical protein|nr:hypothetical protein [Treponema sp.]
MSRLRNAAPGGLSVTRNHAWTALIGAAAGIVIFALFSCALKEGTLEEAPIITSATYQHTQYNGRSQAVEVTAAKDDAPVVITYFRSEEDLEQNRNGSAEPPLEVGDYYARIERPAGNGYRQGKNVKIEYHIQKAFISIVADPIQRAAWNGKPVEITARAEPPAGPPLVVSYFAAGDPVPLAGPPAGRGRYRVTVVFPGNDRYMGASKEIELLIE